MPRLENLLGAWALTLSDRLLEAGPGDAAGGRPLSPSDRAALVTLLGHPDRPVAALCAAAGVSASGATRLVDRLAADGWVDRVLGEGNARERRIRLTPAGERRARDLLSARAAVLSDAVAGLDDAERAVLEEVLERVVSGLADDRDGAERTCRLCDRDACRDRARGRTCPLGRTA